MSGIIYGDVVGDVCPECKESLDIVGDFYEGDEIDCECGATVVIDEIAATYTLSLSAYKKEEE